MVGVVGVAGAGIMLWMAAGSLLALPRLKLTGARRRRAADCRRSRARRAGPVAAGFLISLSNPYWILWWATVGITYLNLSLRFGAMGLAAFFGGHLLADLSWYSLVALGVARGRRFLERPLLPLAGGRLLAVPDRAGLLVRRAGAGPPARLNGERLAVFCNPTGPRAGRSGP